MKRRTLLLRSALALSVPATLLSGCGTPQIKDYATQTPALDLRDYFNGTLDAYGLFTDRSGQVIKRFTVVMNGSWNGNEGVLDEAFSYADGTTQRRVWRLQRHANGRYTGQADDVLDFARGQQSGNAVHWHYTLSLPVNGRVIDVQMDDWMFLMSEQVMLNKAVMSKWGVDLGEVTLTFIKRLA